MRTYHEVLRPSSRAFGLVEKAASRLPYEMRLRAVHDLNRLNFHGFLSRMFGPAYRPVPPGPVAPPELVSQTSLLRESDLRFQEKPVVYFGTGYMTLLQFLRLLEECSVNLRTVGAVLDFGCGTGRLIGLLRAIDGVRLVGTDVNPAVLDWARANVPGVTFHGNELDPPLRFAEDESFDLVLAASVFTHIPLELQRPWLAEIRRILRPGGHLVATVIGRPFFGVQLTPEQQRTLESQGQFVLGAEDPGASFSTKQVGSWDVFQTREQVLTSFRTNFVVLEYVASSSSLDTIVVRKR